MSILAQAKMYWRLTTGLRGFLKEPITLEQARSIIKDRLANRERNFLLIVKRAIYENKRSPYLKLLKLAGCEYGDLENMVLADGIEPALMKLCRMGVYISIEEFKGKKAVNRGNKTFEFKERDFDNPFISPHFEGSTGGSSGAATRSYYDFNYLAFGQAVYFICMLYAYEAAAMPITIWRPILPGNGPRVVLLFNKVGKLPIKWFSPVGPNEIRPSLKNRLGTDYIVYMSKLLGTNIPKPEYLTFNEAWKVTQYIADTICIHGGCYLHTTASNAVRICQEAKDRGLNISGAKFTVGGEPFTKAKRQEIESVGVEVYPVYACAEGGFMGFGCSRPYHSDDIHVLRDHCVLIQREREIAQVGGSFNALLFTSLFLSAPKVLFNVELGDYGILEDRNCGCYWEELGFTEHLYGIRSYDKLTSQGMTFFGSDLIRILEEVLPARFGGASIDYQMVEEEDENGYTRMSVIVSPSVGEIDETELIKTVLTELSIGKDTNRMMADVWSQSKTLRVKRMHPITTAGGKLLPLHIQRGK